MKRVKVAILSSEASAGRGGIARALLYLCDRLAQSAPDLALSHHPSRLSQGSWLKHASVPVAALRMAALWARQGCDVVHLAVAPRGSTWRKMLYAALARAFGAKLILHLHGSGYDAYFAALRPWQQAWIRRFFHGADISVALSGHWQRFLLNAIGLSPTRIRLIANGVPAPDLPILERPHMDAPRITFLGELGQRKGLDVLLAALAQLNQQGIAFEAVIAGNGAHEAAILEAKRLGIADHVRFPGWLERPEVARLLAQSDLFCLPSRAENQPIAILEAMAHGLPVIASAIGGIDEQVMDGQTGLLVPAGSIEALTAALARLVNDRALRERLGEAGQARFVAHYSIEANAAAFAALYRELGHTGTAERRERRAILARFRAALLGPFANAAAQFLFALFLLTRLPPADFGRFAFLMVVFQFAISLWNALFCAPLADLTFRPTLAQPFAPTSRPFAAFFAANALGVLIAGFFGTGLAMLLGLGGFAAMLYGAFLALALLRWFGRSVANASGEPRRVTISDATNAAMLLLGVLTLSLAEILSLKLAISLPLAFGLLLLAMLCALLPLKSQALRWGEIGLFWRDLFAYAGIWRQHARWALFGVLSTEATINAHAYLVTLMAGAQAFAPLAASALMARPLGVVMSALSDFERPVLARALRGGSETALARSVKLFGLTLIAAWLGTLVLAAMLAVWRPAFLFPPSYRAADLLVGLGLWLAIMAARAARVPGSTLLQAAGAFRPLAGASLQAAGFSLLAVIPLLLAIGPLGSLAGILIGEIVFARLVHKTARAWWRGRHAEPANGIAP